MPKNIFIVSGSPKRNGNTEKLITWFIEGAGVNGAAIEVIRAAELKHKAAGCIACRACQRMEEFECILDDDIKLALKKIARADVIVMATPLYFYGASAQLKMVFDRFFSLYKWDNATNTFVTPLKGKTFLLIASAYEDAGLDIVEKPFRFTAQYTGMGFDSLLVPNAGVSGDLKDNSEVRQKTVAFGARFG